MSYKHVSSCPKCGAPIYESRDPATVEPGWGVDPFAQRPRAFFTCGCRKAMPRAYRDPDASDAPESTELADARFMDAQRPKGPGKEDEPDDGGR